MFLIAVCNKYIGMLPPHSSHSSYSPAFVRIQSQIPPSVRTLELVKVFREFMSSRRQRDDDVIRTRGLRWDFGSINRPWARSSTTTGIRGSYGDIRSGTYDHHMLSESKHCFPPTGHYFPRYWAFFFTCQHRNQRCHMPYVNAWLY